MATFTQEHVQRLAQASAQITALNTVITNGGTAKDYDTWRQLNEAEIHIRFLMSQLNPTVRQ